MFFFKKNLYVDFTFHNKFQIPKCYSLNYLSTVIFNTYEALKMCGPVKKHLSKFNRKFIRTSAMALCLAQNMSQ